MSSIEITIRNPSGLHARPAAQLSTFCKQFPNDVVLSGGGRTSNPKSIFSLLASGFKKGDLVTVTVAGEGAQEIAEKIVSFINSLEG